MKEHDYHAVNPSIQPTRSVRHGGSASPRDCPYDDQELLRINREFDARMGWSPGLGAVFTNPLRLPETFTGKLEELWENRV